jgi:hypothetical protein
VRLVRTSVAHQIPDRPPIRLAVGDAIVAGDRDTEWPEFVFVTTSGGSGWVPAHHLSQASGPAVVKEAYDTTELPTTVGEQLTVTREDLDSGWLWCRSSAGREGWVPMKTVEDLGQ